MTRSRVLAALLGLAFVALSATPLLAQTPPPSVAPSPSAAPSTIVVPAQPGTTVVVPPGSTVTVQPVPTTAVAPAAPWCAGAYSTTGGTNFGNCPAVYAPARWEHIGAGQPRISSQVGRYQSQKE